MSDAPERVYLTGTVANGPYVRADLHDAQIAALQAERDAARAQVDQEKLHHAEAFGAGWDAGWVAGRDAAGLAIADQLEADPAVISAACQIIRALLAKETPHD